MLAGGYVPRSYWMGGFLLSLPGMVVLLGIIFLQILEPGPGFNTDVILTRMFLPMAGSALAGSAMSSFLYRRIRRSRG